MSVDMDPGPTSGVGEQPDVVMSGTVVGNIDLAAPSTRKILLHCPLQVVDAAGRSDSQRLTNVLRNRTLSGDVSASQLQILSRIIVLQPDIERQTQCLPVDTKGLFHPRLESLFHPESV